MAYNQQNMTMPVYVQPTQQQHSYAQAPPSVPPAYPQQTYHQYVQPIQPVHVYTVQAIAAPMLGRNPARMRCQACHAEIITTVKYDVSQKTHIIALIMCFFTGCCCIPYCCNACKTASHYCPNCKTFLGSNNDDLL